MSIKILKPSGVSNPNLLINSDFQVWQRGESFNYNVSNKYCADRWILTHGAYYNALKIDKHTDGMQVALTSSSGSGGSINQYVEGIRAGMAYTFSVSVGNVIYTVTGTPNINGTEAVKSFTDFKLSIKWDTTRKCIRVSVWFSTINKTYIVNWAKLEHGSVNTMFSPRIYAEELLICQRYYAGINIMLHPIYAYSQSRVLYKTYFPRMRANPTSALGNVGSYTSTGASQVATSKTINALGVDTLILDVTFPSALKDSASNAWMWLALDAEIY